ncbi:hypothetical protein [Enterococcus sp. LJL90]
MNNSWQTAQDFLQSLADEEKNRLYNDLLAISRVHEKNQDVKHYSLRKIRRASRRLFNDKKKHFEYKNDNHCLVIEQIQEQHWLKTCYNLTVSFDDQDLNMTFVESLEKELRKNMLENNLQPA